MSSLTRRSFLQRSALAAGSLSTAARLLAQPSADALLLKTPSGTLRGLRADGLRIFRGVPFAEPPIGDLRFRAPVPVRPWGTPRDATHFSAAAVQGGARTVPQSEDCLYLNVWSPERPQGKLPVFVWIHGGGFTGGEAFAPIFDGSVFAKGGIVVVTVAYRLGVLGFLNLEPLLGSAYAGSANNAIRDLILALRWVQGNIEAFGGDPTRVTIGGESAGAKLTDLLMGVPSAKALFHGMISESGGAERIWPKSNAKAVSEGFGKLWTSSSSQLLPALKTAPARQLIDLQDDFLKTWPQHFPLRCELDGDLFPDLPVRTIAGGSARGKRLLIGTNRDESALFLGSHPSHDPTAADLGNMSLDAFNQVFTCYATIYPEMSAEQRRIRAVTAEEYWVPSTRVANAAAGAGAEVYAYELDFGRSGGPYKGEAFHSEDLGLVWDKPNREFASAPQEAVLATQVNAAWAAFIRGETPSSPGLPAWPRYDPRTRSTMLLDAVSRIENRPQDAELQLWRSL